MYVNPPITTWCYPQSGTCLEDYFYGYLVPQVTFGSS
jgi:hypothetical protein